MSSLTQRERIEKGLDTRGLQELLSEIDQRDENNDFIRGLIFIEARKICEDKKEVWAEYVKGFEVHGKTVSKSYADRLIKSTREHTELEAYKSGASDAPLILTETEMELTLPKEPAVQMELKGDNAIDKARNYQEIKETLGKDKPSGHEIRAFNKAVREATEKQKNEDIKTKEKFTLPKTEKPDPFTYEEEMDFETWCKKEHDLDIYADKPKNSMAIYALKDKKVQELFVRGGEWKKAYREMSRLCHPDHGGSDLTMSFLGDFNELMKSLQSVREVVDFENMVARLREEYSTTK